MNGRSCWGKVRMSAAEVVWTCISPIVWESVWVSLSRAVMAPTSHVLERTEGEVRSPAA